MPMLSALDLLEARGLPRCVFQRINEALIDVERFHYLQHGHQVLQDDQNGNSQVLPVLVVSGLLQVEVRDTLSQLNPPALLDRLIKNLGNKQSPKTRRKSSDSVSSDDWSMCHSSSQRSITGLEDYLRIRAKYRR